jgi:hypothetical protein
MGDIFLLNFEVKNGVVHKPRQMTNRVDGEDE